MSIIEKLKKKILLSVLLAVAVVALLLIYADISETAYDLLSFQLGYVPLIIALTILNYFLRFLKWDYYLSVLGIKVKKTDSAIVFLSGFTMSVTPGKLGEVLKSYLLKQTDNISMSKTAPIIFAERLTDVIGLVILASFGVMLFDDGIIILVVVLVCTAAVLFVIQSRRLSLHLIGYGERIKYVSRFTHYLHQSYESAFQLLRSKPLFLTTVLSAVSWSCECIAMWYVLKGFGIDSSLIFATSTYAFSSLAGALSMLPGGLGVAEGSIVGILQSSGISKSIATSSALLIRLCTLWLGVFIGASTLFIFRKKFEDYEA